MTTLFLSGILAAWTVTELGLAVFFLLAWILGRRETEYLLFAALCAALAVSAGGLAASYAAPDVAMRVTFTRLVHVGAIAASVLNLHFVERYTRARFARLVLPVLYGLAACYEIAIWTEFWWKPSGYKVGVSRVLGYEIHQVHLVPSLIGGSFYLIGCLEFLAAIVVLTWAWRRGRREALVALAGALCVGAGVINDMLLILGRTRNAVYLLPHTFLVYAFCVASVLLVRYRATAAQLASAVDTLKERTQELRLSNAELRTAERELDQQKQLAAVGELAASIAHEVRNPLAVIVNATAGLRRPGVPDEDRGTLLDILDEETARLNRLVTDLLRYARPIRIQRAKVSLVDLARQSFAFATDQHTLDVIPPSAPELAQLSVDAALLRLVFDNLLGNACQSMPSGGKVTVSFHRDEREGAPCLRTDIQDGGEGMSREVLTRALDPFFTTRPSGTGLGLPIVQRIIEAHSGVLELESSPHHGTTAHLFLPLGDPSEPSSLSPQPA